MLIIESGQKGLYNNLGITGGTTLIGDTAASGNLTLKSTSNATLGSIIANPSLLPSSTYNFQSGGLHHLFGDITQNNQPTWIEFVKGDGLGAAQTARWGVGCLGAPEMNLFMNMNYTGATHRYYDPTIPAIWSFMSHNNGFGLQYVPANNPNNVDIYTTYGCDPFKVLLYNQPATGKGINGFSTLYTAQISLADITNTSVVTNTATLINTNGGVFTVSGATATQFLVSASVGHDIYNSGTSAQTNLKLATSFAVPLANASSTTFTYGTNTGYNIGGYFEALNGGLNIGVIGKSITNKSNATNIGVLGAAAQTTGTPITIGGYFALGSGDTPTFTGLSAGIVVTNGAIAVPIALFRDNTTTVWTIADGGNLQAGEGINIETGTTTGTKFGAATSQKIGFWNATPIVQPTTAIAAATFVANTSGIANDTATWDGYTIGQVVKALRNSGILA